MQSIPQGLVELLGLATGASGTVMLTVLIKSSGPIAFAWLLTRFLSSASARHLVWCLALLGVALVPVASTLLPELELAVLPTAGAGEAPRASSSLSASEGASGRAAVAPPAAASDRAAAIETVKEAEISARPNPAAELGVGRSGGRLRLSLGAVAIIWLIGALWALARLGVSLSRRRGLRVSSAPVVNRSRQRELTTVAARLGIRRQIDLVVSNRLDVPATWGSLRPVVALPVSHQDWPPDLAHSVLLHELAHVRRFDAGLRVFAGLVCAVYWLNPLVWWAARAMRRESELACDDVVVATSGAPAAYAGHLLELVRGLRARVPDGVAAMASASGLRQRIGAILDDSRDRTEPGRLRSAVLVFGMLLLAAAAGAPISLATQGSPDDLQPGPTFSTLGSFVESADGVQAPPSPPAPQSPPSPPSPPAPAVSAGALGERCGEDNRSVSIHGEDDRQRIRIVSGRCKLQIDMIGEIEFRPDETGVARVPGGSYLEIDERFDGTRRHVEFRPGTGGVPEIDFELDGKPATFDAAAQDWVALMIPNLYRMTGMQAEERVGRILSRSGPEGVLEEVRLIQGDYVQRIYLTQLMQQASLSAAQTRSWLATAGDEVSSDYELAETLAVLSPAALTGPEIQSEFVEAASSIGSDYELRRTLSRLVEQADLSAAVLEPMLESAATIGSDYECAELLVAIAQRFPEGAALPSSYYEVAASIGSDYEMGRALGQVAGRPLDEESLDRLLDIAMQIGSDHELANLLVLLIEEQGVPPATRARYEAALETIGGRYEHSRVLEAWNVAQGK